MKASARSTVPSLTTDKELAACPDAWEGLILCVEKLGRQALQPVESDSL